MSEELGPFSIGKKDGGSFGSQQQVSPETIRIADSAAKRIIDESYAKAKQILNTHRHDLDKIAGHLLDKEIMEEADLDRIIA